MKYKYAITGEVDFFENEDEVIEMINECIFGWLYGESRNFRIKVEEIGPDPEIDWDDEEDADLEI